jgi:uncharacterized protein
MPSLLNLESKSPLDSANEARLIIVGLFLAWREVMQVNVAQLLKGSIGSVRDYDVDGVIDVTGDGKSSPVRGKVTLTRTDRSLLVKGIVDSEVELTCGRCLNPFRCPLRLNIEEEFFPTTDIVSGAALPQSDDPDHFTIDERHVLDLTEALRQCALLALPMKPLCREDCGGLCPGCGHNLNFGPCKCLPQETGPIDITDKEKGT